MSEVVYDNITVEDLEIKLFLDAMYYRHGYDFRSYSMSHIKRRIHLRLEKDNLNSISEMIHKVLYDEYYFHEVLKEFSINVTEMFRDPEFFKYFREEIVPVLRTYPQFKIWHAGCSTGEEVYSMAILLKEEGLYDRAQIYATDFNEVSLNIAKEGIYTVESIREYTKNYIDAGGKSDFSDYFITKYNNVIIHKSLKEKVTFYNHNLVSDQSFGEMNIIMCRNVLIYFDRELQDKVYDLFYDSLRSNAFLCLGTKENLEHSEIVRKFVRYNSGQKIYQKKRVFDV